MAVYCSEGPGPGDTTVALYGGGCAPGYRCYTVLCCRVRRYLDMYFRYPVVNLRYRVAYFRYPVVYCRYPVENFMYPELPFRYPVVN